MKTHWTERADAAAQTFVATDFPRDKQWAVKERNYIYKILSILYGCTFS